MIQLKNAQELAKMRRACQISAEALKLGGRSIEAGMTTADLDKIIYDYIKLHGAPQLQGVVRLPRNRLHQHQR